jgi:hypothetical protein
MSTTRRNRFQSILHPLTAMMLLMWLTFPLSADEDEDPAPAKLEKTPTAEWTDRFWRGKDLAFTLVFDKPVTLSVDPEYEPKDPAKTIPGSLESLTYTWEGNFGETTWSDLRGLLSSMRLGNIGGKAGLFIAINRANVGSVNFTRGNDLKNKTRHSLRIELRHSHAYYKREYIDPAKNAYAQLQSNPIYKPGYSDGLSEKANRLLSSAETEYATKNYQQMVKAAEHAKLIYEHLGKYTDLKSKIEGKQRIVYNHFNQKGTIRSGRQIIDRGKWYFGESFSKAESDLQNHQKELRAGGRVTESYPNTCTQAIDWAAKGFARLRAIEAALKKILAKDPIGEETKKKIKMVEDQFSIWKNNGTYDVDLIGVPGQLLLDDLGAFSTGALPSLGEAPELSKPLSAAESKRVRVAKALSSVYSSGYDSLWDNPDRMEQRGYKSPKIDRFISDAVKSIQQEVKDAYREAGKPAELKKLHDDIITANASALNLVGGELPLVNNYKQFMKPIESYRPLDDNQKRRVLAAKNIEASEIETTGYNRLWDNPDRMRQKDYSEDRINAFLKNAFSSVKERQPSDNELRSLIKHQGAGLIREYQAKLAEIQRKKEREAREMLQSAKNFFPKAFHSNIEQIKTPEDLVPICNQAAKELSQAVTGLSNTREWQDLSRARDYENAQSALVALLSACAIVPQSQYRQIIGVVGGADKVDVWRLRQNPQVKAEGQIDQRQYFDGDVYYLAIFSTTPDAVVYTIHLSGPATGVGYEPMIARGTR